MIEDEELGQWISEFHPTVETDVLEVLRARVQYAILDQLNYMISGQVGIHRGNQKGSSSRNNRDH